MIDQYRYFISQGLTPLAQRMLQRFWESALYVVMMTGMTYSYGRFLPFTWTSQQLDLYYLYGLLPAIAMFYMFFNMINAAARFKQRFTPQLNMADHFLLQFGAAAVDRTYDATLAVFDLQGFKSLDRLRYTHPHAAAAVDGLMTDIEHDILALVPRERQLFRYKSNGDEFIMLIYAKDAAQARTIYAEMLHAWATKQSALIAAWQAKLHAAFPDATIDLGMHVLMCTCNDVKITVRGPIDSPIARPDFLSSRFSQLTAAFKDSSATRVAVYADDASQLQSTPGWAAATYVPLAANNATIGYLSIESLTETPPGVNQTAA